MRLGRAKQAGHPAAERLLSSEFTNTASHWENIGKCKLWGNFSWTKKLSWLPEHPLWTGEGNSTQLLWSQQPMFSDMAWASVSSGRVKGLELTASNQHCCVFLCITTEQCGHVLWLILGDSILFFLEALAARAAVRSTSHGGSQSLKAQRKRPVYYDHSLNLRFVGFEVRFCEPHNGSRLASPVASSHGGLFCRWTWILQLFSHFQNACVRLHSEAGIEAAPWQGVGWHARTQTL